MSIHWHGGIHPMFIQAVIVGIAVLRVFRHVIIVDSTTRSDAWVWIEAYIIKFVLLRDTLIWLAPMQWQIEKSFTSSICECNNQVLWDKFEISHKSIMQHSIDLDALRACHASNRTTERGSLPKGVGNTQLSKCAPFQHHYLSYCHWFIIFSIICWVLYVVQQGMWTIS